MRPTCFFSAARRSKDRLLVVSPLGNYCKYESMRDALQGPIAYDLRSVIDICGEVQDPALGIY